ncbi:crossover junction endonuclease EME1B [Canna indica]|uniref:Crossover junction endonuclease EME1B n=1 Tax=Canna indica TaxID=4628 RepID=A0AAQ3L444_9LILI|nr:crossover junction endonuclease EME1B [Canna indica]
MDGRPAPPPPYVVNIVSDDDDDDITASVAFCSPSPRRPNKRQQMDHGRDGGGRPPSTLVIIDDGTTPQKPNNICTPTFVPETPLSPGVALDSDPSIVKCSFARITGLICLESDNESELDAHMASTSELGTTVVMSRAAEHSQINLSSHVLENHKESGEKEDSFISSFPKDDAILDNYNKNNKDLLKNGRYRLIDHNNGETSTFIQNDGDSSPQNDSIVEEVPLQVNVFCKANICVKQSDKDVELDAGEKHYHKSEAGGRNRQLKEDQRHLLDERKQQKKLEKLQKQVLKAEAAEAKKLERERHKWEKGKFALKSIVAEIDAKVIENGSVGGHLLTRFAEKGLAFRVTSNPIQRSILWKMNVPDQITELPSLVTEVPYILLVYQAEEFCDLVTNNSFFDNINIVQSQYPTFTICYLMNKLMSYISKCEQNQYKNPSNVCYGKRPHIEEVLSKLATHYSKVHSRQCIDEVELAETVVGLTFSLANCQFRKKLTWLSVHANGSIIPKDFAEKNLIKRSVWLKALIAIPKVQPRYALAIWKKYPTMRSLLNEYMDPTKSVHDKEFLLKDLMLEGLLGKENRRLGETCSKRVYRILMAQAGCITTDDVEEGAAFFHC